MPEQSSTSEQVEYSKKYYRKHRKDISEKKKSRYQNDPEYREKILERARERRRILSEQKRNNRATSDAKASDFMEPTLFNIVAMGQPMTVRMYTIGQLGKLLGRKVQSIRQWEAKGYLPEALYRSKAKDRLYTELQVRLLTAAFERVVEADGSKAFTRIGSTRFPEYAKAIWKKYPQGVRI